VSPPAPIENADCRQLEVVEDNGRTFEIRVLDFKQKVQYIISCHWTTSVSEIMDLVAPLRVFEFPGCENLVVARDKLTFRVRVNGSIVVLSENSTLSEIGYSQKEYKFYIKENRLSAPHPLITARLQRFAQRKINVCPSGSFNVFLYDVGKTGPDILLMNLNKNTSLDEIVCRLKEKIRSSGIKNADKFSHQDKKYLVFGPIDNAVWDQTTTTLQDLCFQGYESWHWKDGGSLMYQSWNSFLINK